MHRSKADATVTHHHSRHAVVAGRRQVRIPRHLCVHVGVNVNPAGSHDLAGSVNLATPLANYTFTIANHRRNPVAINGNVPNKLRSPRPVKNASIADHDVMHAQLS